MPPHHVAVLALDRVVAFDLAIPAQIFGHEDERGRYRLTVCGEQPGPVRTSTGFAIVADHGLDALRNADTIVVPGIEDEGIPPRPETLDALRAANQRGARMISICTGAFVLAAAGILDGRRATTHWFSAGAMARMFPLVEVDADALYVDEGDVLTSAGLSAGIDLCLHIVRSDHGERVGAQVARAMVASPHRAGGQAQFIERPLPAMEASGSLERVRAWAMDHLTEPLDVTTLAARAGVSPRTFARRFVAETGTTPLKWLHAQRVLEARRLLEHTDLSVEQVAARAGFGSAPSLREHFRRATRTTPTAYRRAFAAVTADT